MQIIVANGLTNLHPRLHDRDHGRGHHGRDHGHDRYGRDSLSDPLGLLCYFASLISSQWPSGSLK